MTQGAPNVALGVFSNILLEETSISRGEIHTLKDLLVYITLLQGRHSEELVRDLMNEVYKEIFASPLIRESTNVLPFRGQPAPSMAELYKILGEFDCAVNPFERSNIEMRDPAEYFEAVSIDISATSADIEPNGTMKVTLGCQTADLTICRSVGYYTFCFYGTSFCDDVGGRITIKHHYDEGSNDEPASETVHLCYTARDDRSCFGDVDLSLDLRTGLAWPARCKEHARLATDEQVATMIAYLKTGVRETQAATAVMVRQ